MTRWLNYAILLAVALALALFSASAIDLWHRQQNFDNCMRQAQAIEGMKAGDRWNQTSYTRYQRQIDTCEYYRRTVESWPGK